MVEGVGRNYQFYETIMKEKCYCGHRQNEHLEDLGGCQGDHLECECEVFDEIQETD